ncbi:MAG: prepilin peptidase [Actinomycetota bacterium]|nr:prepilin peptidase [Actinomycetota bacterium]MDA8075445.1 prepilin peptidase [Actinomycetota bacterium]
MISDSLAPARTPARWRAITATSVAAVEVALAWRFGWTAPLGAYLYLGMAATVAVVIDARTLTMPNVLLLPSYPIGLALLGAAAAANGRWWPLGRAVIAMAALAAFYLALALVAGGQRMGLADVSLGGLIGLLLGWVGWSALSTGVILGWVAALVAILVWRPQHHGQRAGVIPAGPCLWLGALVAVLATK